MSKDGEALPLVFIVAAIGVLWWTQRPKTLAPVAYPGPTPRPPGVPRSSTGSEIPTTSTYIKWVQTTLNRIQGAQLRVDGIYGPRTKAEVQRFQVTWGVLADGVLGPETDYYLKSALGMPGYIEQPYGGSIPTLPEPGQIEY